MCTFTVGSKCLAFLGQLRDKMAIGMHTSYVPTYLLIQLTVTSHIHVLVVVTPCMVSLVCFSNNWHLLLSWVDFYGSEVL